MEKTKCAWCNQETDDVIVCKKNEALICTTCCTCVCIDCIIPKYGDPHQQIEPRP